MSGEDSLRFELTGLKMKAFIRATEIGEFIRYKSCQRRFKLAFNNRELAKQLPFAGRLFAVLDPILQESVKKREADWENYLKKLGFIDLRDGIDSEKDVFWSDFQERLKSLRPNENAYIRELGLSAELGSFQVEGRVDFAIVYWRKGKAKLRLVECKASRRDQTYHRAQLAVYKMLVERHLSSSGELKLAKQKISAADLEAVVARIDESNNRSQAIMEIPAFDLGMLEHDLLRLLSEDGPLQRIVKSPLDELEFQIENKCDDCIFNVHCLPESGRQEKLQLIACDPSTVRTLQANGISSLRELSAIDLTGNKAESIIQSSAVSESLPLLKAKAWARRSTLPDSPENCYPVQFLSYRIFSQLPEHDIMGHRMIRVYLSVDYDYTENRVAGLSAHVTASAGFLHTAWIQKNGVSIPDPHIKEKIWVENAGSEGKFEERPVEGIDVLSLRSEAWLGVYDRDTESERQLLESFFLELVEAIKRSAAGRTNAPLHFYVWNRSEITRLVEACSRAGSELLGHLQELLGCRDSLEQLIFSCVQSEVNNRYALGWTGRGLLVVSSLNWFGWSYHWTREVDGQIVRLDRKFKQDLFDFKAELPYARGSWLDYDAEGGEKHRFEIRSQFSDNLPAGYLNALWGNLPEGEKEKAKKALENYRAAEEPSMLKAYLKARIHALRWIEERIESKNGALQKPPVFLSQLPKFSLKVNHPALAAIDFLRLDFHIKYTDWMSRHMLAPFERFRFGRSIPVKNVFSRNERVFAEIDTEKLSVSSEEFQDSCSIEEKSFVRLSPCSEDPAVSQTLYQFAKEGVTCIIERLDWANKQIEMSPMTLRHADRYRLSSRRVEADSKIFKYATIDENPSDFVSIRVDDRLSSKQGAHAYRWFDRSNPAIPSIEQLGELELHSIRHIARSLKPDGLHTLAKDQLDAVLAGLNAKVQLLHGPPGTGKTSTTAAAILMRIMARYAKNGVIVVSANTHAAVNTLLSRVAELYASLCLQLQSGDENIPSISIVKLESREPEPIEGVLTIKSGRDDWQKLSNLRQSGAIIIGGTVNSFLKLAKDAPEFKIDLLVIDEASMMVFPQFLALATITRENGALMLAGDHRQLSPILAHDWEREDRPPTVLYQPYVSAYEAVKSLAIKNEPGKIAKSALEYTFRLPEEVRNLIARLYKLDEVNLQGASKNTAKSSAFAAAAVAEMGSARSCFEKIWKAETGIYLISHSETKSRQSNLLESTIIEEILGAGDTLEPNSIAVVTPHRAQRALLQQRLAKYSHAVDLIDTVERLQGGERPTIIFSATVSDPAAINSNVDFILDLNRSNVAFSRAKQRLIVVCSEELLNYIPSSIEQYNETLLWKSLRELCSLQMAKEDYGDEQVTIYTSKA
ncbi:MAG: AAA family ATPase [Candidatus Obscuribacterales bacterium]|nr:AAA family ATPase [Candidatus Obscuribacterales bacterium]